MIRSFSLSSVCLLSAACAVCPDEALRVNATGSPAHDPCAPSALSLSSVGWPGAPSAQVRRVVGEAGRSLREAFSAKDIDQVNEIVERLEASLGDYAGVPETRPDYHPGNDRSEPDLSMLKQQWLDVRDGIRGERPFLPAVHQQHLSRQSLPRLRVSQRYGRALLLLADRGEERSEHLAQAIEVYDFLMSQQSSSGVFGYPYAPGSSNRLSRQAVVWADEATRAGLEVVDGDYIVVDPTANGALQFDNGVIGADLIYLYWLTGDQKYLDSAVRAGDWALTQPLSTNWNYNSFAVLLLSRLYRATGEERFLHGAREFAELGVLPGQMSNGRWVDPHNARIQYHSVMMTGLIEYELALEQAVMPRSLRIGEVVRLGLNNLSAQIICHGPSNAHEALAVEALALGVMKYGRNEQWDDAMRISVNFFIDQFADELAKAKYPPPYSMMTYLLMTAADERGTPSVEISGKTS